LVYSLPFTNLSYSSISILC